MQCVLPKRLLSCSKLHGDYKLNNPRVLKQTVHTTGNAIGRITRRTDRQTDRRASGIRDSSLNGAGRGQPAEAQDSSHVPLAASVASRHV
jgi:hypothetical protein